MKNVCWVRWVCVWVMGTWAVGQCIVGDMRFQKMYGLYGLKGKTSYSGDKWRCNGGTTREDSATQLLIWETLSLAIFLWIAELKANDASANMIVLGAQQITKPTRWIITV